MNNEYTNISFPALGIDWNPGRSLDFGSLSIHFYGILIAMGLLLAVIYAWKRAKQFGIREDDLTDGVLWIVPFSIICARLYYCVFRWEAGGYAANPITILHIWEGGLAIYGGVIGAGIGVVVHCLVKKIKIPALLDMVALGFLIGQALGRWGNFFNREAFGAETDFFLKMGLLSSVTNKVTYYHPTFLYESLWNIAGFALLHFLSKRRQYDGQIALGYVAWYGFGRAFIEGLRTDSLYWGQFRVSQLLAAVSCFAAVVVLLVMMFLKHDASKLFVNQVAVQEKLAEDARKKAERKAEKKAKRLATKAAEAAEIAEETPEEIVEAEEAAEEIGEETEATEE